MNKPFLVFSIAGGIGKNIVATAVISSLKKKYPEHRIVVLTAYMDIFVNNPNVYRVYPIDNPLYFREDYIHNDTIIFNQEPYKEGTFIKKEQHLRTTWCDLCGVDDVVINPQIYLTQAEIEFAKAKFSRGKPILVLQANGGIGDMYTWSRDLPHNQAQALVSILQQKYHILHIRKQNQPGLQGVETVTGNIRDLMAVIKISDKRLLIDSFAQHCAAAFDLPSVVCWVGTKPGIYGYECHRDIFRCQDKKFTHGITKSFAEVDWTGKKLYECPYDITDLFSIPDIVEAIG